ncbi:MAG: RnfH family protein [Steroidobacteraceae bacterium]|nr:RnfH family protein [Steroidobacteraceae bacterium]
MAVSVACAEPDRQTVLALELPAGSTAADALDRSGIFDRHPGLDRAACAVGIYGREVPGRQVLRDGDRVEVLRPLDDDPRERRRRLARAGRTIGKGSAAGR